MALETKLYQRLSQQRDAYADEQDIAGLGADEDRLAGDDRAIEQQRRHQPQNRANEEGRAEYPRRLILIHLDDVEVRQVKQWDEQRRQHGRDGDEPGEAEREDYDCQPTQNPAEEASAPRVQLREEGGDDVGLVDALVGISCVR
jgi:hypothetical protein